MKTIDHKADIIIDLHNKGYHFDYALTNEFLRCLQDGVFLSPDDFEIQETHLLEAESKPTGSLLIYAIDSVQDGAKGILMLPYSKFIRGVSIHMWSKLSPKLSS